MNSIFLYIVVLTLMVSAFMPLYISFPVFCIMLVLFIVFKQNLLKKLLNKYFIIFAIIAIFIYPLLAPNKNSSLFGVHYSFEGLMMAAQMIIRGALIISAMSILFANLKKYNANTFWEKIGIRNFANTFDNSTKFLPFAINIVKSSLWKNKNHKVYHILLHPINLGSDILAKIIIESRKMDTEDEIINKSTTDSRIE